MVLTTRRRRDRKKTPHKRVLLNNQDVTRRCFYADGRRGVVRLYVYDYRGQPVVDWLNDGVQTEIRRGQVQWIDTRKKRSSYGQPNRQ